MKKVMFAVTIFFLVINNVYGKEKVNYLVLGDSISTGYGVEEPYTLKINDYLTTKYKDFEIVYNNEAINGLTTNGLLDLLEQDNIEIEKADIITLSIGSNDILSLLNENILIKCSVVNYTNCNLNYEEITDNISSTVTNIENNLKYIIDNIMEDNSRVILIILPYYNPYTKLSDINFLKEYIDFINDKKVNLNKWIKEYASKRKNITFIDDITSNLEKNTNVDFTTLNLDPHPNQDGHDLIYSSIISTGVLDDFISYNNTSDNFYILLIGIILIIITTTIIGKYVTVKKIL